jgi:hypothetical protein
VVVQEADHVTLGHQVSHPGETEYEQAAGHKAWWKQRSIAQTRMQCKMLCFSQEYDHVGHVVCYAAYGMLKYVAIAAGISGDLPCLTEHELDSDQIQISTIYYLYTPKV